MNLGGTSGSRLVSDWSDALWHSWGGWDCDVLGTGTARWKLGVYMSQITAVVIDYFCIIIECTLTLYYERARLAAGILLILLELR